MEVTHGTVAPAHAATVVFRELQDGESVLLDVTTGAYHGLNVTGTAIWRLIDGRRDETQIADGLEELFEEPPSERELLELVTGFIAGLRSRQLVS